ncbi:DnaD domain protein [Lactobacillus xylocopicola]|uniref:Chromosome replication initiation n=1 Tax=Lactobacillus xylocopicola TaxID=2976676 RepID=A0ABN6SKC5_9LACO|nr:DnaD domain protein [Lactobacillus xylocopicola]BDR60745.1 chromosome replication initiation [Lactobacillus xylocopicola]
MSKTPNPKQPFFITNRVEVSAPELRTLVKLYQPLVGSQALALYLSLNEDYRSDAILSDSQAIYQLFEQLDCDGKSLFAALHKLEAVGLVQTRLANNEIMGEVLLFQLTSVPSSSEFFATALLASLLKEKVGVTAFQKLSRDFARESKRNENQVNGMQNAQDISASFMEVFRLPAAEAIDPSLEVKQAARENQPQKDARARINEDDHIDWDFMKQQFEIYQIAGPEIDRNREAIRGVMRTYGLSEQEFVDEALPCLHGDYQLNMTLVKQTIAASVHADRTRQQMKAATPTTANRASSGAGLEPQAQKVLQLAQTKSPAQFLYKLKTAKNDYVDASEYKVIDSLYNEKGIPAELLNILTYACLKSGSNISYRLANKILHDWLQHGVKDGRQALEYLAQREQNKGQYQRLYAPQKRVEKGTDWSKHQAKERTDVSADDLKNFFKNLEDETGLS